MGTNYSFRNLSSGAKPALPEKDDGATVLYGGNISGRSVTNAPSTSIVATPRKVNHIPSPSKQSGTERTWVTSGVGGDFAKMTPNRYLIYRHSQNQYLAGNTTTQLQTPHRGLERISINGQTYTRTSLQRAAGWNYVTGKFLITPSSVKNTYTKANSALPLDQALNGTRAIPGTLRFGIGNKVGIKANYGADT
jgi:hypothetical protein